MTISLAISVGQSSTTYFRDHRFKLSIFRRKSMASLALLMRFTISTWNVSLPGFKPWYICCSLKSPLERDETQKKKKLPLFFTVNVYLCTALKSMEKVYYKYEEYPEKDLIILNVISKWFYALMLSTQAARLKKTSFSHQVSFLKGAVSVWRRLWKFLNSFRHW